MLHADMRLSSRSDDCWLLVFPYFLDHDWSGKSTGSKKSCGTVNPLISIVLSSPTCDLFEADGDVQDEQHAIFHCTHPHTVSLCRYTKFAI